MEALAKLWRERHVDWSPILDVIHSETGAATVESMNGLLAMVGCGNPTSLLVLVRQRHADTICVCVRRWPTPYPNAEQWALGFGVSLCTLLLYFILFGRHHRCVCSDSSIEALSHSGPAPADRVRSKGIEDDLAKAKAKVAALEQKLLTARASESRGGGKEVSFSHLFPPLSTQRRAKPLKIQSELHSCNRATDTGSVRSCLRFAFGWTGRSICYTTAT